jgi:hypothetical protein
VNDQHLPSADQPVEPTSPVQVARYALRGTRALALAVLLTSTACQEKAVSPTRALRDGVASRDSLHSRSSLLVRRSQSAFDEIGDAGGVAFVASPSLHQSLYPGREQTAPVTIAFARAVSAVTVVGDGAIKCTGTYGTLVAYDASGAEVARQAMTLRDASDCAEDDVTFGAAGTVSSPAGGITRIVIEPMSPMTFPVFELTGYATAYYTVTTPAAPPTPTAACAPMTPTRGDNVNCIVVVNGADFTVLEQRAKGSGFTIVENPNVTVSAGQFHAWGGGEAVANSEVKFKVRWTVNGQVTERTVVASFTVQPRGWSPLTLTNAPAHQQALGPAMLAFPTNGTLGAFDFEGPVIGIPGSTATVSSGPNVGISYFTQPIVLSDVAIAWTHPGLYNLTPGQTWYADQNGQGSGTCQQAVLLGLATQAQRHEGVTQHPTLSHWGIARSLLQGSGLHTAWEATYTTKPVPMLIQDADKKWSDWRYNSPYKGPQLAFDNTDSPAIFGSLGCRLDWFPPPQDN